MRHGTICKGASWYVAAKWEFIASCFLLHTICILIINNTITTVAVINLSNNDVNDETEYQGKLFCYYNPKIKLDLY